MRSLAGSLLFLIISTAALAQGDAAANEGKINTGDSTSVPVLYYDANLPMDISAHTAADDAKQQIELTKARIDSSLYYIDAIIKWLTIEEGMTRQQKTKAILVVYVYASWCRWCEAMDSVFANKEIAHYLNQQFIPIKFNAETKTAINYRGKVYKFLLSMDDFVHELTLLLLNNKQSYPGFVVFDETGKTVDVENGYMDAIRFENYLNYHDSNVYKYSSFDDFYYDFQGSVK